MRLIASRCALATSAILFLWSAGGCYEELDDEEPSSLEPATESSSAPPPPSSIGNTPRPGLGGAKRAAQNTAQKIQQEQRKLQETMEEDSGG